GVVAMVFEVEHAREAGGVEIATVPQAARRLVGQQPGHAARGFRRLCLAGTQQAEHGPGGLAGGTGALAGCAGGIIRVVAFAPTAVAVLAGFEPAYGALNPVGLHVETALFGRGQHRPGAVNIVRAPAAIPAAPRFLLLTQEGPDAIQ